jgi:hypothetical protein
MRLLHNVFVIGLSLGLYACSTQPESPSTAAIPATKPSVVNKPQVVVQTPQPKLSPKKAVVKPKAVSKPNAAVDTLTTADVQAMQGTWSLMSFPIFTIQGTDLILVENKVVSKLQPVGNTLQGKMQDPKGNVCDAVLKLKQADALEINRTHCLDKNQQPLSYHIGGAKVFYRTGTAQPLSQTRCEDIIRKRKDLKNAMQKAALGSDERLNLASEYLQVEQVYKDKLCAVMDARP